MRPDTNTFREVGSVWFSGCECVLFQSAEESTSRPLIEDCCRTQWTSLVSSLADSDRVKWTGPSSSQCRGHTRILRKTRSLSSVITSWSDLFMDKQLIIKSFHQPLPLSCFLLGQSCQRDLLESVSGNCAISEQTLFKIVLSAFVGTLSSLFTVFVPLHI